MRRERDDSRVLEVLLFLILQKKNPQKGKVVAAGAGRINDDGKQFVISKKW